MFRNILVVWKKTKYELDWELHSGDEESLRRYYHLQNNNFDRVWNSHVRQLESRRILQEEVFPQAHFIHRHELDVLPIPSFDLIVSLGGDNHFTYVAHKAKGIPLLGCNSDPDTSVGALLSFDANSLRETVKQSWKNTKIEEWTLIDSKIVYPNGDVVFPYPAVSEISVRNNNPDLTSRYIDNVADKLEEQKSSGLLVYSGAGSTGWVQSCSPRKVGVFPKDKPIFGVYSREIRHKGPKEESEFWDFLVEDRIEVISEMNGGISIDSLPERNYNFPPGAVCEFRLSEKKLQVVAQRS